MAVLRLIPLLVVTIALSQLAGAQQPESAPASRPAPADGLQALALVRATFEKTPAWSCQCASNLGMVPFAGMGAKLSTIWRHDAEGRLTGLRATGSFNGGPNVDAATDGVMIRVVDPDKKVYEEGPWAAEALAAAGGPPTTEAGIVGLLRFVLPIELWQSGGLERGKRGGVFLKGTLTLDGVLCDVIELHQKFDGPDGGDPSKGAGTVTAFIAGRDDHLIRRIRKRFISPGISIGSQDAESVYDFTEWRPAADVTDATFTVDVTGAQPGKIPLPKGVTSGVPRAGGGRPAGLPRIELKKGERPPDFALKDPNGKEYKLSAYKGRVVFVHFTPGRDTEPQEVVGKLKEKYGGQLVILDLIVDAPASTIEALKKVPKSPYPRLLGGETVAEAWKITLFPVGVTIGTDGKVASTLMTGTMKGSGVNPFEIAFVKRMGEYLKNPEKGW